MKRRKTMVEAMWEAQEAWRDLAFLFARAIGILWIVRHAPALRLRQWAQDREDGLIPLPGDNDDSERRG